MSKFKGSTFQVGDKVFVLCIPNLYDKEDYHEMVYRYPEFYNARNIVEVWADGVYYLDEPNGFWFSEDSLRLANPGCTQRTILGLETELHSILLQVNKLQEEIDKLKALEE